MADVVRGMDEHFPGEPFSLAHLFLDERRRVLENVIRAGLERYEETYRRIWEENQKLVHYLRRVDVPIPEPLRLVARHVLEQQAYGELERLDALGTIPARVAEIVAEAKTLGVELDLLPARFAAHGAVRRALDAVAEAPSAERVAAAVVLIQGARSLGLRYGHWATQNRFFELWAAHPEARAALQPLAAALDFALPA
jgi:hypothetical protein